MRKAGLYSLFFLLIALRLSAQEAIFELSFNPVIRDGFLQSEEALKNRPAFKMAAITDDTISLAQVNGFFDDFSFSYYSYPDPALWVDSNVFINSGYPVNQPTIGVATFEGLKKDGMPYDFVHPNGQGLADFLTSHCIFLRQDAQGNAVHPSDSVYLSFYYQAQGLGNAPESNDSLVLEFRDSASGAWMHIWSQAGYTLGPGQEFRRVMIPITNPVWFYNGFQFRFKNYATLSGNVDHWNLDYVRLDDNRNINDTISDDVAFVTPIISLLNQYTAVPWNQYNASMMKTTIPNNIRNLFSTKSVDYKYEIFKHDGTNLHSQGLITDNFNTGLNNCGFCTNILNAPVSYAFPVTQGCAEYLVRENIKATSDAVRKNDTLWHIQRIDNYFAYDDGSAEAAYGLTQAFGSLAYRFIASTADTLTGVKFYFNPVVNDVSLKQFKLTVWDHDIANNRPGNIIYQKTTFYNPVYTYNFNGFYEYAVDLPLVVSGIFYVGWVQNSADMLNVGLDRNIDNTGNMFFNTNGTWLNTQFPGTWMIRPVFGGCNLPAGVEENEVQNEVGVYPNPASDRLFLKGQPGEKYFVEIYDMLGARVMLETAAVGDALDVSDLSNGLYIVKTIHTQDGSSTATRIVISK